MKVQNITNIDKFFEVVDSCKGKVELVTGEGDRLNLKSKLSQYVSMANIFSNGEIPELEIICLDSCECFDGNKVHIKNRLKQEENPHIRKLLEQDMAFLDDIQVEMSTARQFLFCIRFKDKKDEQIFQQINRVSKVISEHGFDVRRMEKADVKRMLAIYFEASMNGEEMPDIEGENYLEVIENV